LPRYYLYDLWMYADWDDRVQLWSWEIRAAYFNFFHLFAVAWWLVKEAIRGQVTKLHTIEWLLDSPFCMDSCDAGLLEKWDTGRASSPKYFWIIRWCYAVACSRVWTTGEHRYITRHVNGVWGIPGVLGRGKIKVGVLLYKLIWQVQKYIFCKNYGNWVNGL